MKAANDNTLLKQSFLYTFIWGFVTHGFCFGNITISHDSLTEFYSADFWAKANLGRFFYPIYITFTRGRIVLPWLIGILGLCWISLAVYLIVRMFRVENRSAILLISGICVTNPTVYALAATYIHDFDADMFAMLLSVSAAFLWNKAVQSTDRKKRFFILFFAAVVLSGALGIYQSYISLTITLIIFLSIHSFLEGKKPQEVLTQGFYGIGMLCVTAGLYLIETNIFSHIIGISSLDNEKYNGLGNLSLVFSGNVLGKIWGTYQSCFSAYKNLVLTSYPAKVFLVIPVVLALCMIMMIVLGFRKMEWKCKFLVLLLFLIMPFGMNISYFMSNEMVHMLMQYSVWFVFVLAILMVLWIVKENSVPDIIKKGMAGIVMFCVLMIVLENIQTANTVYTKKELEYQSTLSYMTRVADRMEEQDDYIPGETPVLFVGKNIGEPRDGFERYAVITGADINGTTTYYESYEPYFEYILGRPLVMTWNDELKYSGTVYEMPVFPKQGSVRMIEGTLVVKLK